jgi:hypothetical protein
MMEVINFSETSVLTRAARRYIPEDDVLRIQFLFSGETGGIAMISGEGE